METDADYRKETAIENTLILKEVFTLLGVECLKNVRTVCSIWSQIAAPLLFARSFCTVLSDSEQNHSNELSHFMTMMENFPTIKFINYRFKYMKLTDKSIVKTKVVRLFEKIGKSMVRVDLKRCCLDKTGEFWTNLVRISKWTPNLVELILDKNCFIRCDTEDSWGLPSRHRINSLRIYSDKSDGAMPCDLAKIWDEFPFLETLQLVDLTEDENLVFLQSINSRKLVSSSKPKLFLKELDIFGERAFSVSEIPRNQLKIFCEMRVPLVKLTIDIGEHILPSLFRQFLRAYAPSLKELTMWRGLLACKMKSPGFPYGIEFPALEFLEVPESCILNFNFIHYLPSLLTLIVRQCDLNPIPHETDLFDFRYNFKEWRAFAGKPPRALKELKVEFKLNDESIAFLRGIFPNLRIFSGFVNEKDEVMVF